MLRPGRRLRAYLSLSALLGVFAVPSTARAWIDKTFESDTVTVDVERDGSAVVAHEILLGIRGSPLPEVVLEPVDADAEPLPEATATLAKSGSAAGWPIPLSLTRDGTRLRLHVLEGKGLRGGKYQLRFRYRTSLAAAGKLHPGHASTEVEWSGIGFPDGIDAAKVVFRLPRGAIPPRLRATRDPEAEADGTSQSNVNDVSDDQAGVFLSTLRRTADKDEFELVRPHVAKGEIVSWRVLADRSIFDLASAVTPPLSASGAPNPPVPKALPRRMSPPLVPLGLGAGAGLLYALSLVLKGRAVDRACALRHAHSRPMLPLSLPLRACLAALGLGGAVALLVLVPFPSLAAASLLVTIAAATHLPPRSSPTLRGPGKWSELTPAAAFDQEDQPLPGSLADVGTPLGFVLFTALLMGFVAAALVVMRRSPYQGVALALGASVLFPLFFTGRSAELPEDAARAPRALLEWLLDALTRDEALEARPVGRVPLGGAEHDELRLLVMPKRRIQGLVAIEIGMDCHSGPLGALSLPFVLVRVVEGMPAADVLPKGLLWTRGRDADERVAVLRPKVPTRRLTLKLTRDIAQRFTVQKETARRQAGAGAAKSTASGTSSVKPGTSSPAHAT
ncbi:MAG TPA: hypothetical protein VF395_06420 [Polyangiaceae bacterium]